MLSKQQLKADWAKKLKYMQYLKQSVQPKLDPIELKAQHMNILRAYWDWCNALLHSHPLRLGGKELYLQGKFIWRWRRHYSDVWLNLLIKTGQGIEATFGLFQLSVRACYTVKPKRSDSV